MPLQAGLTGFGTAAGRGQGQPLQKQNCTFGGPQVSQHQAETWCERLKQLIE